jgi:hypothetical protein
MTTLGETIAGLRASRGWSQGRLAAVLAQITGRTTISRMTTWPGVTCPR